jgi:glycosyltransferase involved in cell wall biosynthesis
MNVLEVRPLLFQVRALQTQGARVIGARIWDETQDPSITPKLLEDNKDILWLSWYPARNQFFSFISKTVFFHRTFRDHKIDFVQINGLRDLFPAFIAKLFTRAKPRIIVTSHNPGIWKSRRQQFLNATFIDLFADGIITLSTRNYNQIRQQGVNEKKLCFIPNAFPGTDIEFTQVNRNDGQVVLFYPASLIPRKNQLLLLKVVNQLKDRHNISVFLAGDLGADEGYVRSLKDYCRQNAIEDRVHFLGKIPHQEVLSHFAQCDLVVFPTLAEMMPRAVIEAMWLGKPVIASGVDGILDLIRNNETGKLVDVNDVDGFSAAITALVGNPGDALKMAREGQKFVQEACSLESVGRSMVSFYQRISNEGNG